MLQLYNTLTRTKELFKPLNPPKVKLYSCGPTVYNYAHIGNLRTYIFNDFLKRTLQYNDFDVKQVMNITDVGHLTSDADTGEDKMEKSAREQKKDIWKIAEKYTQAFQENQKDLNILEPEIWCKATDHIKEQITLIKKLEEKKYTYKTSDGIYFDTAKFKNYTKLAKLNIEGQEATKRVDSKDKKNPTDFALWKFSYPNGKSFDAAQDDAAAQRQMEWDSAWGKGFPGWHLECSAMSMKYLGETLDIHTGGIDHIPVHHTNEIAQSEAANGKKFVNYWMHGDFLVMKKTKMAKSAGAFITLADVKKKKINPLAYRFFCLSAHYRAKLTFTWKALQSAEATLDKLYQTIYDYDDPTEINTEYQERFHQAVNNDLDMPKALAIMWELVKSDQPSSIKLATLFDFDQVFGLQLREKFDQAETEKAELPEEILEIAEQRETARAEKNWKEADKLRKQIEKKGYQLEDTSEGYKLRKK